MKEGYLGNVQGKSSAGNSRKNHQEKNRIFQKRRGDQGSSLEHQWQGKPGIKYSKDMY